MLTKFIARAAFATLLATTSTAALAQSDDSAAAPESTDIIVTAQKIDQRLVDVPITVTAVTGEQLRQIGVSDLGDISAYVPGLNIQKQSANNPGFVIRGITSDSGSSQEAARVTVYYNGVDISRSRGVYQDLYDIDRIEVIKGPQATLFGTAAAIGAVSIISKKPKAGYSGELTAGYGNYNQYLLDGYLNAGNDVIAGRIAFAYKKRDGYVRNLAPNQNDLNGQDQLGLRGSLRFTPTDSLTIDLVGTYDRQRDPGTAFISGTLPTAAGPANPLSLTANLGGSPYSAQILGASKLGLRRDVYDANLTVSWDFGEGWNLTLVNGYRQFNANEVFDADGSAAWFLEFAEDAKGWQASQETRFTYTGDHFRAAFGLNYFHEQGSQRVPFSTEEGTFLQCAANVLAAYHLTVPCVAADGSVPAANTTAILTGGAFKTLPYSGYYRNSGTNDSYSVFGDMTWTVTPKLELTAGVRGLIEQRIAKYASYVPYSVILTGLYHTPTTLFPLTGTGGVTSQAQRSFAVALPRFNALYRLNDRVNLYATISKGRRSPVVQLTGPISAPGVTPVQPQIIPAETVWNYEAGIKGGAGIVSGSLGVYYDDYSNFQVSVIDGSGRLITQNAGSAKNLGIEAELNVRPTQWLTLFANGGYISGGIDKQAANGVYAGSQFRLQPKYQAAGGFTVNAPVADGVKFFATPSVTYRSRIYFEVPNSQLISQGPVALVNLRAGFSFADDRFEIAGVAQNLLDRHYLLDAGNTGETFGYPTFIPAQPRIYSVRLTGRF